MFLFIGIAVVLVSVFGGFMLDGGELHVLFQPFEFMTIFGAAVGAYVIANPKTVLTGTAGSFKYLISGSRYHKEHYMELLSLLYSIFKTAKLKGMLALEAHVENPSESALFQQFPLFAANPVAVTFTCDYLRLLTLGTENHHEVEALIDEELETHNHEYQTIASALTTMADGLPAFGIVAAVLGVIHTMGSITQPPAVLGHLIGGALVGTFLGVLLAYGFVGPVGASLRNTFEAEHKYFQCIKTGILAHMQGYAPAVAVEFARKSLLSDVRPTFYEVEEATSNVQPV